MSNPNAKPPEHTKWKPGQSGNPAGPKPGYKHISTWIEEMLNDEGFETLLTHPTKGYVEYKGAPLKAIIGTAVRKAINGDKQWADWLANNGYGQKLHVEMNDPRPEILGKYMGGKDAGEASETEGRSSSDPA